MSSSNLQFRGGRSTRPSDHENPSSSPLSSVLSGIDEESANIGEAKQSIFPNLNSQDIRFSSPNPEIFEMFMGHSSPLPRENVPFQRAPESDQDESLDATGADADDEQEADPAQDRSSEGMKKRGKKAQIELEKKLEKKYEAMWDDVRLYINNKYHLTLPTFFSYLLYQKPAVHWRNGFSRATRLAARRSQKRHNSWFDQTIKTWFQDTDYGWIRYSLRAELCKVQKELAEKLQTGKKVVSIDTPESESKTVLQKHYRIGLGAVCDKPGLALLAPMWFRILSAVTPKNLSPPDVTARRHDFHWAGAYLAKLAGTLRPRAGVHFKQLTGMFLWSQGLTRAGIEYLFRIGVTPSYDKINSGIHDVMAHHAATLKDVGRLRNRVISWDNIQFSERVKDKNVGDEGRFLNYTTGFAKLSTCIPPQGIQRNQFNPNIELYTKAIFPFNKVDQAARITQLRQVRKSHIVNALRRVCINEKVARSERPSTPPFAFRPISIPGSKILPPKRTESVTFAALPYDEATEQGTIDITSNIHLRQFGIEIDDPQWEENLFILSGDVLTIQTVSRMQSAQYPCLTAFDRAQWLLPVMGLFHLRMNYLDLILYYHFGGQSDDSASLYQAWHTLYTSKFVPSKSFEQMHRLVVLSYEAKLTALCYQYLCDRGLAPEGLERQDFIRIIEQLPEDETHNMQNWICKLLEDNLSTTNTEIRNSSFDGGPERLNRARQADMEFQNNVRFISNVFPYIMLTNAIKFGDIGLLKRALIETLVIYAGADRRPHYRHEIARMVWLTSTAASDSKLQSWILEELLVNTQGKADTWYEVDKKNELINYDIRAVNHAKRMSSHSTLTMISRFLATHDFFSHFQQEAHTNYQIRMNNRHSRKDIGFMIWMLVQDLMVGRKKQMPAFTVFRGRGSVSSVPDLWADGARDLPSVIAKFNLKMQLWRTHQYDAVVPEGEDVANVLSDMNEITDAAQAQDFETSFMSAIRNKAGKTRSGPPVQSDTAQKDDIGNASFDSGYGSVFHQPRQYEAGDEPSNIHIDASQAFFQEMADYASTDAEFEDQDDLPLNVLNTASEYLDSIGDSTPLINYPEEVDAESDGYDNDDTPFDTGNPYQ